MISPSNIRVNEYRRQDLLAEAARARLIKAATSAEPVVAEPSTVGRLRAAAHRVMVSLAGVSFATGRNRPAAA